MISSIDKHTIELLNELDMIYATLPKAQIQGILTAIASQSVTARQLLRHLRMSKTVGRRKRHVKGTH